MSSLPHPVDSGDSSQSLLSRRQSEIGSRYVVESGFFMSSFTATFFITAVLAIGVLMLTLLIALTVMLESCQSNGSGVLDDVKKCDQHDYCSLFVFHAELNNLEVGEFPMICESHALQFIQERYLQNLNTSLWFVEEYYSTLKPDDDGLDVILLDADDILSLIGNFSRISPLAGKKQFEDMKFQASVLLVRLQMQLRATNWSFILFTRKPAEHFNTTWSMLTSSGYAGWSSLIMRSDDEIQMESWEYLTSRRLHLQKQGFRFAGLISSQLDAFRGTCLGRRNFKLPNLLYYELSNVRTPQFDRTPNILACLIGPQRCSIERPCTQTCSIGHEEDTIAFAGRNSYSESDVPARMACDRSAQELNHCTLNDEWKILKLIEMAMKTCQRVMLLPTNRSWRMIASTHRNRPSNSMNSLASRCIKLNDDHKAANCTRGVCGNATMMQSSDFHQNAAPNRTLLKPRAVEFDVVIASKQLCSF